jgi:hypothetical protein
MDSAQSLGLNVFKSDPRQRGFSQPCPLWQGQCTIYTSPHYPRFCRTYKCKLLKEVLDENMDLPNALSVIQKVKKMIQELEALLPVSAIINFRERLVAHMEYQERFQASAERGSVDQEFLRKARSLLALYENQFGVKDLIDHPEGDPE